MCRRGVGLLERSDGGTELVVAEHVFDPTAEVAASEVSLHHALGQRREDPQQIPNRSRTVPRRLTVCVKTNSWSRHTGISASFCRWRTCVVSRGPTRNLFSDVSDSKGPGHD